MASINYNYGPDTVTTTSLGIDMSFEGRIEDHISNSALSVPVVKGTRRMERQKVGRLNYYR